MTDRDAMLRAVLDRPADDLPRLVFADWLDEHGSAAWAEFIRLQIDCGEPLTMAGAAAADTTPYWGLTPDPAAAPKCAAGERAAGLLLRRGKDMIGRLPPSLIVGLTWHRGFAVQIRGPLGRLTRSLPAFLRVQPLVDRAQVANRTPWHVSPLASEAIRGRLAWFPARHAARLAGGWSNILADEVYDALPTAGSVAVSLGRYYETEDLARGALSAAILSRARTATTSPPPA